MGGTAVTDASAGSRPARNRPQLLAASYWAGARMLRATPSGLRQAAAAPGGVAWFWLSRAQRHAALDNYAAAMGRDREDPDVARAARPGFPNFGPGLVDLLLLGSLTPSECISLMAHRMPATLGSAPARRCGGVMGRP